MAHRQSPGVAASVAPGPCHPTYATVILPTLEKNTIQNVIELTGRWCWGWFSRETRGKVERPSVVPPPKSDAISSNVRVV